MPPGKILFRIEPTALCLSPDEAKTLFDLIQKGREGVEAEAQTIAAERGWTRVASVTAQADERLLSALRAIKAAGPKGLSSSELAKAAGYKKQRAVSAVLSYANRRLTMLGLHPQEVFQRGSGASKERWYAADGISKTLTLLDAQN